MLLTALEIFMRVATRLHPKQPLVFKESSHSMHETGHGRLRTELHVFEIETAYLEVLKQLLSRNQAA